MNIHAAPPPGPTRNRVVAYFADRWRGETPLAILFWRDMAAYGTLISAVTTITAIVLLAAKVPAPLAVAVHFSPLPYNIFLVIAVWRTADRSNATGLVKDMARAGSAIWIMLATIV